MKNKKKRLAVLTSGGDGPGMNAAIRSVVRTSIYKGAEIFGIMRGYTGLIENEFIQMNARSVSNILNDGGTILKTSRSKEFCTYVGRKKAFNNLKKYKIDGLIVIGGNGSFKGAHILYKEFGAKIIGVPGTIDNDVNGSDFTIGCSTALNTALDAIDKIRDTVTSMERIYVIEVMGRDEPYLALRVALAGGAEDVIYPQTDFNIDQMCDDLKAGYKRGKISWIIIVSEGAAKAHTVSSVINEKTGFEVRPMVLGHIQRGGSPDSFDRILASRLGYHAVDAILDGHYDKMVGIKSHKEVLTPLSRAVKKDNTKSNVNKHVYDLIKVLAI